MALERSVYFVTCAPGVEPALHAEARALRLPKIEQQVGGERFEGTRADAWRANLCLRTAVRVLERVARFTAEDADALYARGKEIPWERWLAAEGSLAVQAQSAESMLDHTRFLEQRVKDAVVDRFRERTGVRPSVERDDPDLRIHLHLWRDRATLSLDTSGEALHRRGWRVHQGRAPLAENLAAALVHFAEWDARSPLVDPFCGTGTILIEAALRAAGRAPGGRRTFAFERWLDHDAKGWAKVRAGIVESRSKAKAPILLGSDVDPERVAEARANAESAGVADRVRFEVADAREVELKRGWNAWVVANLPYGLRVGGGGRHEPADVGGLVRAFGEKLREAVGWRVGLLVLEEEHVRALGLAGMEQLRIVNGGLECRAVVGEVRERSGGAR